MLDYPVRKERWLLSHTNIGSSLCKPVLSTGRSDHLDIGALLAELTSLLGFSLFRYLFVMLLDVFIVSPSYYWSTRKWFDLICNYNSISNKGRIVWRCVFFRRPMQRVHCSSKSNALVSGYRNAKISTSPKSKLSKSWALVQLYMQRRSVKTKSVRQVWARFGSVPSQDPTVRLVESEMVVVGGT